MTEMLFLPGLIQDQRAFDLVVFAGRTPVYPGHGKRPAVPITLPNIADEIAATLTKPVDIVGVALGGIVGQYLLIRHPHLVRSAILANTMSGMADPSELIARADDALRSGMPAMSEALIARWFRPGTVAANTKGVRYAREIISASSAAGFAFSQRAMAETDTARELPEVHAPVTLVRAASDPVGARRVARIHQLLPNSRLVEIEGSHSLHLDNPAGFRDVIIEHREWADALEDHRRRIGR